MSELNQKIELARQYFSTQASEFPGKVSYLYRDLKRPMCSFMYAKDDSVVSASTIKVPIMLCLFDKMQRENISFDTYIKLRKQDILEDTLVFEYGERDATLYELTVWMIENSDNTATNVIMNYLGFDKMNEFFKNLGIIQTRAQRIMLDYDAIKNGRNNYISNENFFSCMKILYEKSKTDILYKTGFDIMKHNRDHGSLMRYLYEEPICAHKTGSLDSIVHDAGIFETQNGVYYIGVFISEFEAGEFMANQAERLIGRLSRCIYDCYK